MSEPVRGLPHLELGTRGGCESTQIKTGEDKDMEPKKIDLNGCVDHEEFRRIRVRAYVDVQRGLAMRTLEDLVHFEEFAAILHHQSQTTEALMSGIPPDQVNSRGSEPDNALNPDNSSLASSARFTSTLSRSALETAPLTTSGVSSAPRPGPPGQGGNRTNVRRTIPDIDWEALTEPQRAAISHIIDPGFVYTQRKIAVHLIDPLHEYWAIIRGYSDTYLGNDPRTPIPNILEVLRFQEAVDHVTGHYQTQDFTRDLEAARLHLNEPEFRAHVSAMTTQAPPQTGSNDPEPVTDVNLREVPTNANMTNIGPHERIDMLRDEIVQDAPQQRDVNVLSEATEVLPNQMRLTPNLEQSTGMFDYLLVPQTLRMANIRNRSITRSVATYSRRLEDFRNLRHEGWSYFRNLSAEPRKTLVPEIVRRSPSREYSFLDITRQNVVFWLAAEYVQEMQRNYDSTMSSVPWSIVELE